jgi:hypothetical protein
LTCRCATRFLYFVLFFDSYSKAEETSIIFIYAASKPSIHSRDAVKVSGGRLLSRKRR